MKKYCKQPNFLCRKLNLKMIAAKLEGTNKDRVKIRNSDYRKKKQKLNEFRVKALKLPPKVTNL